ncbi:MAG: bifunctional alpha,alpha-trehalose-phosphate synthase (UDP-forming)/trehalose-phosphatase [Kiritimatiellia bacterium]
MILIKVESRLIFQDVCCARLTGAFSSIAKEGDELRLLILSNRLQVTVSETNNSISIQPSSGGLVSGMSAYLSSLTDVDYLWVGWPGSSNFSNPDAIKNELIAKYHSWPVFVEESTMDLFYNGFCNKTLWPLFHYFPGLTMYDEKMWENYKEVNTRFAEEVSSIIRPGDVVWIHDYHFMLAPKLIRNANPDVPVGFFLHIPFPSYEIFRLLPRKWGKEILEGLLDADLVGFHTRDYTQYFLRCVLRILGFNHDMGLINLPHKLTKADTFPMGIDYEKYHHAANLSGVEQEKAALKKKLQNLKVIFAVDRQDYTKGIANRLEGYELFLKKNPEWRQKVQLIMIVVPSRIGVEDYRKAKDVFNRIVGNINSVYGDVYWTPIIYQYKAIPFEQLIALYNISNVGLITPLRDGMNLVAKEYIAAQKEKQGVLVLSEMAGAAMELGEAVIINPSNREEIAEGIKTALEMPASEQAGRMTAMQERLKNNDVSKWARNFLMELDNVNSEQKKYGALLLEGPPLDALLDQYRRAQKRIIFLDYDGTLAPFAKTPSEAAPSHKLLRIIKLCSLDPTLTLVIISGRNKEDLQNWFGKFNVILVSEHGAWIRKPKAAWTLAKHLNNDWKPAILKILNTYRERLPQSFIEAKEYGVAWHFRNSNNLLSEIRVKEFVDDMTHFTARNEIEVLMGNKVVEIKCSGISKGETARQLLSETTYDFILAAGDDATDESLFHILPQGSFTIKIGIQMSYANYYLHSSRELLTVLAQIVNYNDKNEFIRKILDFFKKDGIY